MPAKITNRKPTNKTKQSQTKPISTGILAVAGLAIITALVLITANTIALLDGTRISFNQSDASPLTERLIEKGKTLPTRGTTIRNQTPTEPIKNPPLSDYCGKMLIPAYFYPGTLWDRSTNASPKVGVMIMNPNSGPGDKIDQNYVKAVDKAQQAGIKILGYVATTYGNKRLEESTTQISNQQASVFKEINQYYNWYGVDGIFLDESASGPEKLDYYKQISEHIKSKGGQKSFTVLNPGVYPDEGYTKYSDVILTFEGTYQSYQTLPIPSWSNNYDKNKFMHLIYNTAGTTNMDKVITLASNRNVGYLYVTNDNIPNPWDTLPSYFQEELDSLNRGCNK
jgi:hypothetical protein